MLMSVCLSDKKRSIWRVDFQAAHAHKNEREVGKGQAHYRELVRNGMVNVDCV